MNYFDPATWKSIDPNNVMGRQSDESGNMTYYDLSGVGGAQAYKNKYTDENGNYNAGYGDQQLGGAGGSVVRAGDPTQGWIDTYAPGAATKSYLSGLAGQGYTANDFENARNAYLKSSGANLSDTGWWGDQASLRALGTGFDSLGKNTGWNSLYNASLEPGQQKYTASQGMQNQAMAGSPDDKMGVLAGLLTVLSAGAAGGAFAGMGAAGAGAAADLTAGFGAGGVGYGAGSATLGGAAGMGAAGGVGSFLGSNAVGGVGGGSGGTMFDWADPSTWGDMSGSGINNVGTGTVGGDVTGSTGSDWATNGLNADGSINQSVMTPGSAGNTSLLDQIGKLPSGLQNIAKSLLSSGNGSSLGALLGGVLGGVNGSKQAGTTTVNSTSDFPSWYLPYAQGLAGNAAGIFGQQGTPNPALVNAANQQQMKTVNGDYLNPETNPYLKKSVEDSMGLAAAGVNSQFSAAGRYGSGAQTDALGTSLGRISNNAYMNNYNMERGNQVAASNNAPAWFNSAATAPYANINAYGGALKNATPSGQQSSQTTPYYTNPMGGMLSGALAGSQFGKMWGA